MHFSSNHPTRHKYATVRHLYNRLDPYNLQQEEYQQELNIKDNILYNNYSPIKPHKPPTRKTNNNPYLTKMGQFYVRRRRNVIYIILKRAELKIALPTAYTLPNLFTHKDHAHDKYSLSGVYRV